MPVIDLKALLPQVVALADRAGALIMTVYEQTDPGVSYKADDSPLTRADMASHRLLMEGLSGLPPRWPVLSEESRAIPPEERQAWPRYWLVDPLDGTKEFIKRRNEFTVNVALIENHEPVLGVVYAPALKVCYYAARGVGAWKRQNDQPPVAIRVADYRANGLKMVVSRSHAGGETEALVRKLDPAECISIGSSLKLCLVAEGRAHLYPRLGPTMEWDIAAAQCVVEAAGGTATDFSGNPLRYNKPSLENPNFIVCGYPPFPWRDYLS
ncbi:MAG: 3'(2'),5'-bisphosphate nucleotidase CysQ [Nitrospirota bacterium]